jgi:sec-independent protein translocase protein TatC
MSDGEPTPQAAGEARLIDHLIELRARLMRGLAVLLVAFFALMPFAGDLFHWLIAPLLSVLPSGTKLIPSEVLSPFMAPVKVAFFAALLGTMPWLLYQAWAFVAPGLYRSEKRLALPILISALVLFYSGCAFAYFLVLPGMFKFLSFFASEAVVLNADPSSYLDFVTVISLAFGLSFELPVALVILVALGLITPKQLREWRGYAVVAIFILAAVVTPPDVISQLLLAIPLCILYELGILASVLVSRRPKDA